MNKENITVEMIGHTDADPIKLAKHAALICYQSAIEPPKMDSLPEKFSVENQLFKVGHHTTLEHWFMNFYVEGIPVGDITFGPHLDLPFYNSDQRSGRYCADMFATPNYNLLHDHLSKYFPLLTLDEKIMIIDYVVYGVNVFHDNIGPATDLAMEYLKAERPNAAAVKKMSTATGDAKEKAEKQFRDAAKKVAQEQMRNFISTIFPTGFDFTINLITLAGLYQVAWTPVMRDVTQKMVNAVLAKFPDLYFMFYKEIKDGDNVVWLESIQTGADFGIGVSHYRGDVKSKPDYQLIGVSGHVSQFKYPMGGRITFDELKNLVRDPIDKNHTDPRMMNNNVIDIHGRITCSVATMGQDQRHRTVRRGMPKFTGNFYAPPIVCALNLGRNAIHTIDLWLKICKETADRYPSLGMTIAPYGAMVTYEKRGSVNAVAHEGEKRLCWCAQEEIYHVSVKTRAAIEKKLGKRSRLLRMFEPYCFKDSICMEGGRYCGRDKSKKMRTNANYFPNRKV